MTNVLNHKRLSVVTLTQAAKGEAAMRITDGTENPSPLGESRSLIWEQYPQWIVEIVKDGNVVTKSGIEMEELLSQISLVAPAF